MECRAVVLNCFGVNYIRLLTYLHLRKCFTALQNEVAFTVGSWGIITLFEKFLASDSVLRSRIRTSCFTFQDITQQLCWTSNLLHKESAMQRAEFYTG